MAEKHKSISESEIQAALQQFLSRGGLIEQLPPQQIPSRLMGESHTVYENPASADDLVQVERVRLN